MEERADVMTNEQMWTLIEFMRSIILKSKDKEEILKELDRIMDCVKSRAAPKTKD